MPLQIRKLNKRGYNTPLKKQPNNHKKSDNRSFDDGYKSITIDAGSINESNSFELVEKSDHYSFRQKLYDSCDSFDVIKKRVEADQKKKAGKVGKFGKAIDSLLVNDNLTNKVEKVDKSSGINIDKIKKMKITSTTTIMIADEKPKSSIRKSGNMVSSVDQNDRWTNSLEINEKPSVDSNVTDEVSDIRTVKEYADFTSQVDLYRFKDGISCPFSALYNKMDNDTSESHQGTSMKKSWSWINDKMKNPRWSEDKPFCTQLKNKCARAMRGNNFIISNLYKDLGRMTVELNEAKKKLEMYENPENEEK